MDTKSNHFDCLRFIDTVIKHIAQEVLTNFARYRDPLKKKKKKLYIKTNQQQEPTVVKGIQTHSRFCSVFKTMLLLN